MKLDLRMPLLLCTFSACAEDPKPEPTAVGESCDATFTVTLSDGSTADLGSCVNHGIEPLFRHEPTGEVKLRTLSFIFRGGDVSAENCWVRWDQAGLCDQPFYPFDTTKGALSWSLDDCPGVDGGGEGEATAGYAQLKKSVVTPIEGDEADVLFKAKIHGGTDGAVSIDGTVEIAALLDTSTTTEDGCEGNNGDVDGDGFHDLIYGGDDCDDESVLVHPEGLELCNGIDDNCDGQIDEDLTETFYRDSDGDGWGDEDTSIESCEGDEPSDYVDNALDCDDTDADIHPNLDDICDDIDNDCDGTVDEDCD